MQKNARSGLITIIVAYLAFAGLGLNAGLLGLAWPSIQQEFAMPLDAVATLLLAGTTGYLTASFLSGTLAYRFGAGRTLALGGAIMALGLVGIVLAHSWSLLIVCVLVGRLGDGMIDSGLNAYMAQHHGARTMNWLHACFGIGVTIIPLIMREVFAANLSWRIGYAVVCGSAVCIVVLFVATLPHWKGVIVRNETSAAERKGVRGVLRMPVVWIGIVMFFLYAGLEAMPGQWAYSLFTLARSVNVEAAALWVSVYWGSFTVGRFFFGAIITRVNTLTLLRVCMLGAVLGALLLWWNSIPWIGFVGLGLLGFAQAPLFPVLVSETPKRVGMENAGNAIGFQVAGAGIGVALLPSLAGFIAQRTSLEAIPPTILVAGVLLFILHELSVAQGARLNQHTDQAVSVSAPEGL